MSDTLRAEGLLSPGEHGVLVEGLVQRYHVHGRGPLLLAHPGGPGIGWEYLRSRELEQHTTVVYVEPVGTGSSGRLQDPSGYSWDRYARQVTGLLDALGLGQVDFLGHSAGGCVGLQIALDAPGRLRSLVLYDSTASLAHSGRVAAAHVATFAERHGGRPEAVAAAAAFTDPVRPHDDESATARLHAIFPLYVPDYWSDEAGHSAARSAMRYHHGPSAGTQPFDVRDRLPEIDVPTLVFAGEEDFICGPELATELAAGIPGARLELLPGIAHIAHAEAPEVFTLLVTDFLRGVAAR